jgi:3',5'-cyclic AMP phosphodiesterase CpdA
VFTIAQISDLHITTDRSPLDRMRNEARLRAVIQSIQALNPRPVAILASGDLVDRGEEDEYRNLRSILDSVDIPVHLAVGNHDLRDPLRSVFDDPWVRSDPAGFIQYGIGFGDYRVIVLDSLEAGTNGGGFCSSRANWLKDELERSRPSPTLLIIHHPPVRSGIQWMDESDSAPWIVRLRETIAPFEQVRTIGCGHMHRPYSRRFGPAICQVAPATSIQLTLNLTAVDMRIPDGREILLEEPPGFLLHAFDGGEITSHVCVGGAWPSAVSYLRPFIGS